jgi:hypothetical protein
MSALNPAASFPTKGAVEILLVDLGRGPQLVKDVVATARVPVNAKRDLDALRHGQRDVGRLVVEDEIAPRGPDQLGARRTHLLELGVPKRGAMDDRCAACQQVLRLQRGEFGQRLGIAPHPSARWTTKLFVGCRLGSY